jgi:C1A family cysteine protease
MARYKVKPKQAVSPLAEMKIKRYGWKPDLPDHRDFRLQVKQQTLDTLPASVDLSDTAPAEVYDQGQLGSCTGNAIAAAVEFLLKKQGEEVFTPSRLFIYYAERVMEHSVKEDAGAMIRDGIKSVNKQGVPHETLWPYNISQFTKKPRLKAYSDAKLHQSLQYMRVDQTLEQMKGCLASGYPFVVGFSVYESFESSNVAQTGTVPMPTNGEQLLGGHAVLCIGYDDSTGRFLLRNSWGSNWGNKGNFTMLYEYLLNNDLSDDFWTIRLME